MYWTLQLPLFVIKIWTLICISVYMNQNRFILFLLWYVYSLTHIYSRPRFVSCYINKILDGSYYGAYAHDFVRDFKGLPAFLKTLIPITLWNMNGSCATIKTEAELDDYLNNYNLRATKRKNVAEYGKYLSFPQFTQFALVTLGLLRCRNHSTCLKAIDVHVQPQWVRCDPCALQYDAILKVSTFVFDRVWWSQI